MDVSDFKSDFCLIIALSAAQVTTSDVDFVLDGGASNHMVYECSIVARHSNQFKPVQPALGPIVYSEVVDFLPLEFEGGRLIVRGGIYNKALAHNLLSERVLLREGWLISENKRKLLLPPDLQEGATGDNRKFLPIVWGKDGLLHVFFRILHVDGGPSSAGAGGGGLDVVRANSLLLHRRWAQFSPSIAIDI